MADAQWDTALDINNLEFIAAFEAEPLDLGLTWDIVNTQAVRVTATRLADGVLIEVRDIQGATSGEVFDGYTPVKGVDYFTEEEIEGIEAEVAAQVEEALKTYVHSQMSASAIWDIVHNLGKRPSVTVVDSGDNTVVGDIRYISDNELVISFSGAFSGKAYLN